MNKSIKFDNSGYLHKLQGEKKAFILYEVSVNTKDLNGLTEYHWKRIVSKFLRP
jgi:hypothetical protein